MIQISKVKNILLQETLSGLLLQYLSIYSLCICLFGGIYYSTNTTNSDDLWENIYFSAANQATLSATGVEPSGIHGKLISTLQTTLFGVCMPAILLSLIAYKLTVHTSNVTYSDFITYNKDRNVFSYRFYFDHEVQIIDIECTAFLRKNTTQKKNSAYTITSVKNRQLFKIIDDFDKEPIMEIKAPILIMSIPPQRIGEKASNILPKDIAADMIIPEKLYHIDLRALNKEDELILSVRGRRFDTGEEIISVKTYKFPKDFRCGMFKNMEDKYIKEGRVNYTDIEFRNLNQIARTEQNPCKYCKIKDPDKTLTCPLESSLNEVDVFFT